MKQTAKAVVLSAAFLAGTVLALHDLLNEYFLILVFWTWVAMSVIDD